MHPKNEKIQNI